MEKELRKKNQEVEENVNEEMENEEKNEREQPKEGFIARFVNMSIKKKMQYVGILLIIIVMLAIFFASSSTGTAPEPATQQPSVSQGVSLDSIEAKLKQTLSNIEGAGLVEVMITYESSAEIVPAISVDTQTTTTTDNSADGSSTTNTENKQHEIVTISGSNGSSALVLREESPKVKGVLVIAEGADDIGVRLSLLSAVQTILNISPDQVDVYKMNIE